MGEARGGVATGSGGVLLIVRRRGGGGGDAEGGGAAAPKEAQQASCQEHQGRSFDLVFYQSINDVAPLTFSSFRELMITLLCDLICNFVEKF